MMISVGVSAIVGFIIGFITWHILNTYTILDVAYCFFASLFVGIVGYFIFGIFVVTHYFTKKEKPFLDRKKEILKYYGIARDPVYEGTDYEIAN